MKMDETLFAIAEKLKNYAVMYLVDITKVPDFNKMYELYDPCTVMFFFRNKHIMIDLGTGNNNKINWAMEDKQVMVKDYHFVNKLFWISLKIWSKKMDVLSASEFDLPIRKTPFCAKE